MAGVNKVILLGNLGADPEIKVLENGVKLAHIRLATTERYRDREGNRQETTEWHRVILWRGLAEIAERYLHKGDRIYVEGKIKTRSWQDQQGQDRYMTEIVGDNMVMLSSTRSEGGYSSPSAQPAGEPTTQTETGLKGAPQTGIDTPASQEDDDDLPF